MSELLPCPFCGGEASKRLFYKGKYRVHCNVCDAHSGDVCDTEAEAIAAWNTRAYTTDEVTLSGMYASGLPVEDVRVFGMTLDEVRQMMKRDAERGRTCKQVLTDCDDGLMPPFTAHCSACGDEWGFTPNYCPNCGARVVE